MSSARWIAAPVIGFLLLGSASAQVPGSAPAEVLDPCEGPAGDPEPGTAEWIERDALNMACAEQRHADKAAHPVTLMPLPEETEGGSLRTPASDAYRAPERHAGVRFRYETLSIGGLESEVYRPCAAGTCPDLPDELETFEPPYPAVVVLHGGASRKELHWWSNQPLAEAGYLVVTFNSPGYPSSPSTEDAETILDWLFDPQNPLSEEVDPERVGIAGHSAGGVVATRLGQSDPRIAALVSWDRAQSGPIPDEIGFRTPAMYQFADYNCQRVPVCQPEPYVEPPDPEGPGNKGEDFVRTRAAGIDTMQIGLRAALHLDWVPSLLAGNRYGEIVSVYYTLAWFDRYLKGKLTGDEDLDEEAARSAIAADAFARLAATEFDDSADVHNLSQGFFDPVQAATSGDPLYGGNVPYTLAGKSVANRLSFYFLSKCFLSAPGSPAEHAESTDLRTAGCGVGT